MQKIIRFDSNLDRKIYINFFRVNWSKNGIKWRKTLNFKIFINDVITVITEGLAHAPIPGTII
jgi:hypothetical protein